MTIMIPAWVGGEIILVEKLEVHERGLKHEAVSVFVMEGDRVLLQQRALSKYHTPGLWANTCCSHPDFGEGAEECARRRLFQELGSAGVQPKHCGQVEYRADVGGGLTEHEVVEIFAGVGSPDMEMAANPSEVAAVRWVSLDDLQREIDETPEAFTLGFGFTLPNIWL